MLKLMVIFGTILITACDGSFMENDWEATVPESQAIVGGQLASPESALAASTVSLMYDYDGEARQFCAGTIISKDLILTANHCAQHMKNVEVKIFWGTTLPTKFNDPSLLSIKRTAFHPQFKTVYLPQTGVYIDLNDVALIRLSQGLSRAKPVAILDPKHTLKSGQQLLVGGYGITDERQKTKATSLKWATVALTEFVYPSVLVADQRSGSGACAGDSGGPAYYQNGRELILAAIVRGPHGDTSSCTEYGEYTYVPEFKKFLIEQAKKIGAQAPIFKKPSN